MNLTIGKTLAAALISLPLIGCDQPVEPVGPTVERSRSFGTTNGDARKTTIDEPLYTRSTLSSGKGHDFMIATQDDGTAVLLEEMLPLLRTNFERSFSAGFVSNDEVFETCASACDEHGMGWEGELDSEAVEFQVGTVQQFESEAGIDYEFPIESHVETRCVCVEGPQARR